MPSHREDAEIILRLEETELDLRAQPTEKRTCALTAATAETNVMHFMEPLFHKNALVDNRRQRPNLKRSGISRSHQLALRRVRKPLYVLRLTRGDCERL